MPEKNIQTIGLIQGWVDIVGFSKMSRENEVYYVPGDPKDYAIVQGDAKFNLDDGYCNIKLARFCLLYWLKKDITTESNETHVTAKLTATAYYLHSFVRCGDLSCWYVVQNETAQVVFVDTERSPKLYPKLSGSINVTILQYNTNAYESAIIGTDYPDNIFQIGYNVSDGSYAKHTVKLAQVNYTSKNISFADVFDVDIWNEDGDIGVQRNNLIIPGNFSNKTLTVTGGNLYETINDVRYNHQTYEYHPERGLFHPVLIAFVLIILLCVLCIIFVLRGINL